MGTGERYGHRVHTPYEWTPLGLPCYRVGDAPRFLVTQSQLEGFGLRAGDGPCAYVDSQHGPAALYLITDAVLANPNGWPPARPES